MVIVLITSKLSGGVGEYLATEKRVNEVARRQRTSSSELQCKYTNNIYKSKKKSENFIIISEYEFRAHA